MAVDDQGRAYAWGCVVVSLWLGRKLGKKKIKENNGRLAFSKMKSVDMFQNCFSTVLFGSYIVKQRAQKQFRNNFDPF